MTATLTPASASASRKSKRHSFCASASFCFSSPGPFASQCDPRLLRKDSDGRKDRAGALYYAVHVGAEGRLARVKIKSPSFSNWRAFPFTVHDTNMMDYAINEASFGLTVAGCDR